MDRSAAQNKKQSKVKAKSSDLTWFRFLPVAAEIGGSQPTEEAMQKVNTSIRHLTRTGPLMTVPPMSPGWVLQYARPGPDFWGFSTGPEPSKPQTADARTADVTGLGLAIREVWARLLELSTRACAIEATREADETQVANHGPAIFANYYEGAHDRVGAAGPVVSFRKLAL